MNTTAPAPEPVVENRPAHRLITQNLLISAMQYEERTMGLSWASIADLSSLIDLFCLYDQAFVVGRPGAVGALFYIVPGGLIQALQSAHFLEAKEPSPGDRRIIDVEARRHLAATLGRDPDQAEGLTDLLDSSLPFAELRSTPDEVADLHAGYEWLYTTPEREDLLRALEGERTMARPAAYYARTFLYLAYALTYGLGFTPDTARAAAVEGVLDAEEKHRARLLQIFDDAWQEAGRSGHPRVMEHVSPFAAIVFDRAKQTVDKKSAIPGIMLDLRTSKELTDLRAQLRRVEDELKIAPNAQAEHAAWQRWDAAITAVAATFNPTASRAPWRTVTKGVLELIPSATRVALTSGHDLAGDVELGSTLVETALDLPPIDKMLASAEHAVVVDIRRLSAQVPGSGQLLATIEELFGPIGQGYSPQSADRLENGYAGYTRPSA